MIVLGPRHWSISLAAAMALHAAVAVAVMPAASPETTRRTLGEGVAVSLGGSVGVPGSIAAAPAEQAADTPTETLEAVRPSDAADRISEATEVSELLPQAQEIARMDVAVETAASVTETATSTTAAPTVVDIETQMLAAPPTAMIEQAAVTEARVSAPAEAVAAGEPSAETLAMIAPGAGSSHANGSGPGEAAGGEGGNPGEREDFFAAVQAWLEQHKRYPRQARMRSQTGVVLLRFVLLPDGRVREYEVVESSGFATLDAAATKLIERAQPMPRIPEPLARSQLELVVPIAFQLR